MQYTALTQVISCFIVAVLAVALICDRRYEDGCIGRLFLGLLFVACLLILYEYFATEVDRYVRPPIAWFDMGVAGFMLRHADRQNG